jgi:hypothetical protein
MWLEQSEQALHTTEYEKFTKTLASQVICKMSIDVVLFQKNSKNFEIFVFNFLKFLKKNLIILYNLIAIY